MITDILAWNLIFVIAIFFSIWVLSKISKFYKTQLEMINEPSLVCPFCNAPNKEYDKFIPNPAHKQDEDNEFDE
jgi:hypothetical protein